MKGIHFIFFCTNYLNITLFTLKKSSVIWFDLHIPPSYFTRVSNRSPHHPHRHHEDLPGIRPNTYTELRKSPPKGFLTSLKIPQKRKSTLLTHSFHSTSAFHHQISKADSSPPSKQSYKERVPRRASSMLHPGVGGPWVLFGSVRRSFSGIKVYVICGRFQSILCWVISRSWKVNSVIKIRVFIATRRLQVQSVCIQGLPGGVILIVQLLVLLAEWKGKKNTHLKNTDVSFPFCIFKYFVGSRGAAVSGAHHVCSQEGGF